MPGKAVVVCVLIALSFPSSTQARWCGDHTVLTKASFESLPETMPAFFRAGVNEVAHYVCDPDLFKNNRVPGLSAAEFPEHIFDVELLNGHAPPLHRHEFISLCDSLGVAPSKVGFALYAITEWTDRLTIAFAEHRRWPDNEAVQSKCLVYAGILSHYTQDLCQPLHVTIHFDGYADENGRVPHSGIHEAVDSIIQRLNLSHAAIADGISPVSTGDIRTAVEEELTRSRALIDVIYDHEQEIRTASEEAASFANERSEAAARFTASLLLSAWHLSESVELPGWLRR